MTPSPPFALKVSWSGTPRHRIKPTLKQANNPNSALEPSRWSNILKCVQRQFSSAVQDQINQPPYPPLLLPTFFILASYSSSLIFSVHTHFHSTFLISQHPQFLSLPYSPTPTHSLTSLPSFVLSQYSHFLSYLSYFPTLSLSFLPSLFTQGSHFPFPLSICHLHSFQLSVQADSSIL